MHRDGGLPLGSGRVQGLVFADPDVCPSAAAILRLLLFNCLLPTWLVGGQSWTERISFRRLHGVGVQNGCRFNFCWN